ncbi:MAG TPA: MarR family winged helix-turn-helix transcriptional regulator [Gaiellaceae bacterium]|nr:MarR family winged helix-turn-helix transcriptional regulator [Gaiellaceae bacterium]
MSTKSLDTVLDLALARTLVLRHVDVPLGHHHGVSLSDLALLLELRDAPGEKMRRADLAQCLGVTPSGIARQVGPLERIGLVGRESNPRDARLALVTLTDAGKRVADEAAVTAEEAATSALRAIWSDADRERLSKLLAAVRR